MTALNTPEITTEFVAVTPELAEEWLLLNRHNRPLRQMTTEQYAGDMTAGSWRDTAEAIKFDVEGNLLDGQHRLAAVVFSGRTITFLVARGLQPLAQDVLDTGIRRTAADALTLAKIAHGSTIASAVRIAINYDTGQLNGNRRTLMPTSNSQILGWIEANPDIVNSAEFVKQLPAKIPALPAALTWSHFMTHRIAADEADDFMLALSEMRTDGQGDPRFALLRRLNSARDNADTRLTATGQTALILRTWNAVRSGEAMHRVQNWSRSGALAIPAPR